MNSRADIEHLLNRAGFGGTDAEIDALLPMTWGQAVNAVLDVDGAEPVWHGVPTIPQDTTNWAGDYARMVRFWLERCRTTGAPIREKMTLFWHGHFACSTDTVTLRWMMDQQRIFRAQGLGRFDNLVKAVATTPAMLHYLGNRYSHKWSPNENFARELLELFTLGAGNYTETDIRELSRAWTGWTIGDDNRSYRRAEWHDNEPKTILGATRNWDGPPTIGHILRGPTQPIAARFLARKLWEFFAYENPADTLVDDLADAFIAADLRINGLLRAIFMRNEFRSQTARQGRVRSPIEYVVAVMKRTGMDFDTTRPDWSLPDMGQTPFTPPSVEGWPLNDAWISTSTTWARAEFVERIARLVKPHNVLGDSPSRSVDGAVDHALATFGLTAASAHTRNILRDFVVDVRANRTWAEEWGLTTLALSSPEFCLA